jgi:hypothetical protein
VQKIKTFMLSFAMSIAMIMSYITVPAATAGALMLVPDAADAAECSLYETIHPNFPLTGSHLSVGKCSTCASCHTGGTYLGTPKVCATCHNGNPLGQISSQTIGRSAQHIPIVNTNCDACHNTTSFTASWSMTHSTVSGQACSNCHNGSFITYGAMGKDANHIVTANDCGTCHVTVDKPTHTNADFFIPLSTIHNGITTGCVSCHDGSHPPAMGKSNYAPGHPATSDACETCHSINNTFKCASLIEDKQILAMMKKKLFV